MEEEVEERLSVIEEWLTLLQTEADRFAGKLDTGTLGLRASLGSMDGMLADMAAQRRRMLSVDELEAGELRPEYVEPTFLSPYTPIAYKLRKAFNKDELALLAHEVGIDLEDLGGSGLLDICRRLVEYAVRRHDQGLLDLLIQKAGEYRPPVEEWAAMLE